LAQKGSRTYSMMKETASVQISLDYTGESDAVEKLRLAMGLAPVLTALMANSPLEKGARSPFYSRRAEIWRHTAPERTGFLWKLFEPGFTFQDYIQYALEVPLLFLQRDGQWLAPGELSFGDFLRDGWNGFSAMAEDWDLHLTSIFTEARLKKYIELRSMDCPSPTLGLAAVALVKGIFYHAPSRREAWDLIGPWPLEERRRLAQEAPRTALQTRILDTDLLEVSRALLKIAARGLPPAELKYLAPLQELVDAGLCPAQRLLNCIGGRTEKKEVLDQIIRCCAI
jgi:glutamate--cysteine ligase